MGSPDDEKVLDDSGTEPVKQIFVRLGNGFTCSVLTTLEESFGWLQTLLLDAGLLDPSRDRLYKSTYQSYVLLVGSDHSLGDLGITDGMTLYVHTSGFGGGRDDPVDLRRKLEEARANGQKEKDKRKMVEEKLKQIQEQMEELKGRLYEGEIPTVHVQGRFESPTSGILCQFMDYPGNGDPVFSLCVSWGTLPHLRPLAPGRSNRSP